MTRTGFYNELDALKEDYPDADWGFLENTTISDEMKLNAYDFLHGSCLNFAMVLHELYGYDIECIFSEEDSSLVHAYCKKQIDEVIYFIIQPKKTPTSKRSLGGAMNSLMISFLVLIRIIEISFSINSDFSYFYAL